MELLVSVIIVPDRKWLLGDLTDPLLLEQIFDEAKTVNVRHRITVAFTGEDGRSSFTGGNIVV